MSELNAIGDRFERSLGFVEQTRLFDNQKAANEDKLHVVGAGRTLFGAYEQLRNAADNADESLFMQRAIRRFFRRTFLSGNLEDVQSVGDELVTELTLADYIANNSVSTVTVRQISELATAYFDVYQKLDRVGTGERNFDWTTDVLAIEVELMLRKYDETDVFLQLAFEIFLKSIDWEHAFKGKIPSDYELMLYAAIHRALLKSDDVTIRRYLLYRFQRTPKEYASFIASNRQIDELLQRPDIDQLARLIDRNGASLRVLRAMLRRGDKAMPSLANRRQFLLEFESQIDYEYDNLDTRIKRGVVKSVIFLVITKFLIGLAVEVPYDLLLYERVVWLPLAINFLAPVLYIVSIGLTLTPPGPANTEVLVKQIEAWLYKDEQSFAVIRRSKQRNQATFSTVYGLIFVAVFGLVAWGLVSLGFDIVHLIVFFTFFSAASFLGFRLTRSVRELEAVASYQSGLTVLRDFVYLPFIVVGQKINQEYSKLNLVANLLDIMIEMPLKSILRFVRQWSAFISSKKDDL